MPQVIWSFFIFIFAREAIAIEETCGVNWESFGNSCYLFVQGKKNWENSRLYCLERGADLVSLTTDAEILFVYVLTSDIKDDIWIGLNKINRTTVSSDRAWVWSNGERRTILRWARNEPNDLKDEHCVEIEEGSRFWRNRECDKRRAWICEKKKRVTKFTTYTKSIRKYNITKINITKINFTKINFTKKSIRKPKVFPEMVTTKKSTIKDQTTNPEENLGKFSMRTALYIFLPMILLALTIIIGVIVTARVKKLKSSKKESSRQEHREEETAERGLNRQTDSNFTIIDGEYTELHHIRDQENTYTSLNIYETPDANYTGAYVISNDRHNNQINEETITAPQAVGSQQRSSYVIPAPGHRYDLPENT